MQEKETDLKLSANARWTARLQVLGLTLDEICQELNLDENELESILDEPGYLDFLNGTEAIALEHILQSVDNVDEVMASSSVLAARLCSSAMVSGRIDGQQISPSARLKAAQDILDRTGHSSKNQNNVLVVGDVDTLVKIYEKRKAFRENTNAR